jgi:hypothetical protein
MMKIEQQLEDAIRSVLDNRAAGVSMCPSEAARRIGGGRWRSLMEPARRAAYSLSQAGEVEVSQKGVVVDPTKVKGPIRIRRRTIS